MTPGDRSALPIRVKVQVYTQEMSSCGCYKKLGTAPRLFNYCLDKQTIQLLKCFPRIRIVLYVRGIIFLCYSWCRGSLTQYAAAFCGCLAIDGTWWHMKWWCVINKHHDACSSRGGTRSATKAPIKMERSPQNRRTTRSQLFLTGNSFWSDGVVCVSAEDRYFLAGQATWFTQIAFSPRKVRF